MSIIASFVMPHPPIIVPQIGRGEEKKIQRTIDACNEVAKRVLDIKPDTIVLTTPHAEMYFDYFHIAGGKSAKGNFEKFGAYYFNMTVDYDYEFVKELSDLAGENQFPAGTLGERDPQLDHGTTVPLYFINQKYKDYKLVRIGLSDLSPEEHYQLGKMISNISDKLDRKTVFLASGDLSHKFNTESPYGFVKEGPEFDLEVTKAMADGDFLTILNLDRGFCDAAAECGLRSFWIMAGALDKKSVKAELLSHEGPFGIGYGVASFIVTGKDNTRNFDEQYLELQKKHLNKVKQNENPYVKLARNSIEHFVNTGNVAKLPSDLPAEMIENKAGVFVSLKKHGLLRGCIGTISPVTKCIGEEILRNAVSACSEDPRFAPVEKDELDKLVYSVDVLGKAEDIEDRSQLDIKRYGVIVTNGIKRGLLLPNLEGIDSVDQQIEIAMQKAGIGKDEPYSLQRFEVVRHY